MQKPPIHKSHPWHGVVPQTDSSGTWVCFVEIVPSDQVKYEIDKASGYLKIDRPQLYSNVVPALYGFIPQTLCDVQVAERCMEAVKATDITGDQDPLDVCILTQKTIVHGDILVRARIIGGLRMIDKNQADDKILAVLEGDEMYEHLEDVTQLPEVLLRKIKHYFLTYKDMPGEAKKVVNIAEVYGSEEAGKVIAASLEDYQNRFGRE